MAEIMRNGGLVQLPFCPVPGAKAYQYNGCSVVVGRERGRWHMSIAHPRRYPTWDEIRNARYALIRPDVTMVMVLPRSEMYVNVHPNCFHLWETRDTLPGEW